MGKITILALSILLCLQMSLAGANPGGSTEIAVGLGIPCQFVRVGRIYPWGEVALRYFRTFDMFSEHCDDNHELAAMYYFVFPRTKGISMFFRAGVGLAFCDRECGDDEFGIPIELSFSIRLGRTFSLGVFGAQTLPSFFESGYRGGGLTASLYL